MSVPQWNPPDSLSCAIFGKSWHLAFDLPRGGWTRGSTEEEDESDGITEAISGRQVTKKLWAGEEWPTECSKVVESSRLLAATTPPLCSQLGWRRARWSEEILPTVVDPTWENYKFSNMGVNNIVKSNKTASSHRIQHNILFIPPSPFPVMSKTY